MAMMTEWFGLTAIGDVLARAWRPELYALTTIVGGLLTAAIVPKGALGWIEGNFRSLALVGLGRSQAAPGRQGVARSSPPETGAAPVHGAMTPKAAASIGGADLMTTMLAEGRTAQTAPVTGHQPKMDTAVTAGGLEYVIEVPGVKAAELELQVVGGTIVVRGRQDLDQTNRTYRAVERAHGPFLRTLSVPEGARLQDIEAALDRGLLTVFIPNPPILAGRTIAVNSTVQRLLAGDDRYELKLDLPGVDASDITLVVRDGRLTIGRREATLMAETADQPGDQASGPAEAPSVSRIIQSMELPAGVDANLIGAVLAKGVLTVTLPIVAGYRRRIIPVEAEG